MKTLKDIKGVKTLGKNQQQAITGGRGCNEQYPCPTYACCINGVCKMICDQRKSEIIISLLSFTVQVEGCLYFIGSPFY